MSVSSFGLNFLTKGLVGGGPRVSDGLPFVPFPATIRPNHSEITSLVPPLVNGLPSSELLALGALSAVRGGTSSVIVPTSGGFADLGGGHSLTFDPTQSRGQIKPAIGNLIFDGESTEDPAISYSGSDLRIVLESTNVPQAGDLPGRLSKHLLECTTISISVFRAKAAARAAGYIGVRGYARGGRTIAGTMVLTQFAADVLRRFLHGLLLQADSSKDSNYLMVDQLPPFNMTLVFCNEAGYASYSRLLGVELANIGTIYSHNDMYTEQTISYMASQMTPLLPLDAKSLMAPMIPNRVSGKEKTVQDVWDKNNPPVTSDIFNA